MREALVLEFSNLRKGIMSVNEYALWFNQLSKYIPSLVAESTSRMNMFVLGGSNLVVKKCHTMLIGVMDISPFMTHDQQIEEEKLKGELWRKKGLEMMMVIIIMKGSMDMVVLSIKKGFLRKIYKILLSIVKIMYLTLNHNVLVMHYLC